jgi:hypothetical protein
MLTPKISIKIEIYINLTTIFALKQTPFHFQKGKMISFECGGSLLATPLIQPDIFPRPNPK